LWRAQSRRKQLCHATRIDGFDQVSVEPRFDNATPVFLAIPSGDGDQ
jgi:hypothetical protein